MIQHVMKSIMQEVLGQCMNIDIRTHIYILQMFV